MKKKCLILVIFSSLQLFATIEPVLKDRTEYSLAQRRLFEAISKADIISFEIVLKSEKILPEFKLELINEINEEKNITKYNYHSKNKITILSVITTVLPLIYISYFVPPSDKSIYTARIDDLGRTIFLFGLIGAARFNALKIYDALTFSREYNDKVTILNNMLKLIINL